MAGRRSQQRILRATRTQVAAQLRNIEPLISADGSNITELARSPDATFWQATITTGFTPFNGIQQELNTYAEFDAAFIITNLISAVDNTVTAAMIDDIYISPSDSTRIEVSLKRKII